MPVPEVVERLLPAALTWRRRLWAYQRNRGTPYRESVCNAPFTNMYFSVKGHVAPCWLHWPDPPPEWGPERSLLDIWRGPELEHLRTELRAARFPGRCSECRHDIETGNRPLAAAYDNEHPIGEYPTMLELELSNLCNLECIMCHGQLSSKIRKNREHLPPLHSPYDESFAEQVAEIAPHLQELRINGGEPLLQPVVHQIVERVGAVAPELRITIATNGTVMNAKVRRLLEVATLHFNISIDSLVPERYESIRVDASFEKLMANFEVFREYCARNDRNLAVMVNPMRVNWDEMADFVWWCTERDVDLWFNTIREPAHLALHNLDRGQLSEIHDTLAAAELPIPADGPAGDVARNNVGVFRRLVDHQLTTWRDEAGAVAVTGVPVQIGRAPTARAEP